MKNICLFLVIVLSTSIIYAQEEKTVTGKIQSATIFRIGAELVHTAKPELVSGNNELVVEGLSASIDVNSLQITCSGGVSVMGSEFFKDYLSQKKSVNSGKKLQDSIDYYNKDIKRLETFLATNKELRTLLQDNKSIGGQQNGVTVAELMKMMDYYKAKSLELETEKAASEETIARNKERIAVLTAQLVQESGKNNKISGKLRLKLVAPLSASYDLEISYYTPSAYWVPYYDLYASSSDKPVKMTCKARFMQTTGLDWNKVSLTLSTATPANGKTAPVFETWFLSPIRNVYADELSEVVVNHELATQNTISYKDSKVNIRGAAAPVSESNEPLYVLNGQVISQAEMQSIDPKMIERVDVLKDASATAIYGARAAAGVVMITLKNSFITESETETDLTYKVDLPYNLLTTGSEQSVTLRTLDLPATFEYYCAPKLDKTTYLIAGIKDWAQYNLLPGEANITYAGTYAGKSAIDPNTTRDVLHLTLGNDKRVVVKREKLQDFTSTKFLGNDKEQQFAYQLTVKNNKNIPIDMILKDQYPISTEKNIVVKLLETDNAHVNDIVGTLTWEFKMQPGESKTFRIKYSVKYPKDMNLGF